MKVYTVPGLWVAQIRGIFLEAGYNLCRDITEANIVVWSGGADVHPKLYGEPALPECYFDEERDKYEIAAFKALPLKGGPLKVGICRGAQLLCALSGGKLKQDINGHGREHDVIDSWTGEMITVSSMHHQEMIPPAGSRVWAKANLSSHKVYYDRNIKIIEHPSHKPVPQDVEAVWIPETDSFCFQAHPEVGPKSCTQYFFKLIDKALLAKAKMPTKKSEWDAVEDQAAGIQHIQKEAQDHGVQVG